MFVSLSSAGISPIDMAKHSPLVPATFWQRKYTGKVTGRGKLHPYTPQNSQFDVARERSVRDIAMQLKGFV